MLKKVLGLLLLCLLWSLEWLREMAGVFPTPPALRAAMASTAAALCLSLIRRRQPFRAAGMGWAVALLAAPVLLTAYIPTAGYATPVLWTLAPLLIGVLATSRGEGAGLRFDLLLASCLGSAGALLIFPFQFPSSPREALGWSLVLLAVASAAAASVHARHLTGMDVAAAAAVLWIANAATGTGFAKVDFMQIGWSVLIDLPALLLLLWLLDQLAPEQLASRYLFPVVFTIVCSGIVLRQRPSFHLAVGVLMMAGAGVYLLKSEPDRANGPALYLE